MVQCSRKRKICFFWSTAVIIAIEMCIFFFLLLYYNIGSHASVEDTSGSSARFAENGNGEQNSTTGILNILPSINKHLLVDFSSYNMYLDNMNALILEYSKSSTRVCRKSPTLDLGDCTSQSLYGILDGVFCLIARLEETNDWIPDEFLQTDWLPNYDNKSLSISCDIIAQNASVHRNGKLDEFYYKNQLRNIWPASGFSKEYFPLFEAPSNCYPPVTIKVDDPFVLNNYHDDIKVTCSVWTNNWKKLAASSTSINVTILQRGHRGQVTRKSYISPQLPFAEKDRATSLKSTTAMKTTAANTNRVSSTKSARSERAINHSKPVTENVQTSTKPFTQASLSSGNPLYSTTVKTILTNEETWSTTVSKTTLVALLRKQTSVVSTPETTPSNVPSDESSPSTARTSPTVPTVQVEPLDYYVDNSGSSEFPKEASFIEHETTTTRMINSNVSQEAPAETSFGFLTKISEDKAFVSVSSKEFSSTMFSYSTPTAFTEPSYKAELSATSEQNSDTSLDANKTASRSYTSDTEASLATTNTDQAEEYADEEAITSTTVPFVSFVEGIEAGAESNSYD